MLTNCPVCDSLLKDIKESPNGRDSTWFSCPRCGDFILSRTLLATLPKKLEDDKNASAKISHALRTMQQVNKGAELFTDTVEAILKQPLPSPKEQVDLFVRWLGENVEGCTSSEPFCTSSEPFAHLELKIKRHFLEPTAAAAVPV